MATTKIRIRLKAFDHKLLDQAASERALPVAVVALAS